AIRYVQRVEPCHAPEQFPEDMWSAADAVRCDRDLRWVVSCISDEFMNRPGWKRRRHDENAHPLGEAGNWRDIADVIETEIVIEGRIPAIIRAGKEQRVPVRCRSHDCFRGNTAAGTSSVLNDERLTQMLRKPLSKQTGVCVVEASHDKAN